MPKVPFKVIYFLCFLVVCFLIGFAAYLQYKQGIIPSCSLDYIERSIMVVLGAVFLTIVLYNHTSTSRKIWSWAALLICVAGALVAVRHAWLQRFVVARPEELLPQFKILLQEMPILKSITLAFDDPFCSHVQWSMFGLSQADLVFIFFTLFGLICFWQQGRKFKD